MNRTLIIFGLFFVATFATFFFVGPTNTDNDGFWRVEFSNIPVGEWLFFFGYLLGEAIFESWRIGPIWLQINIGRYPEAYILVFNAFFVSIVLTTVVWFVDRFAPRSRG